MFFYKKKVIIFSIFIIFFVCFDRFLKVLAMNGGGPRASSADGFLNFSPAANYGVAFSLPFQGSWLMAVVSLIILFFIFLFLNFFKKGETFPAAAVSAVILGASSNLFDRLKYGFVVDYIDLKYFTVFNLADAMIVVGFSGLVFFWLVIDKKTGA